MQSWDPIEYVDKLMDGFAKPCIVLYRPWIPPLTASTRRPDGSVRRTKLGGLPNLSESVEWPYGYDHYYAKKAIPLHFLAQIDCSELPALGRQLPASGMLYFFANTDDTADWGTHTPDDYRRVIYLDDVPADVVPRNPPPNTPDIGRQTRRRNFPDGFNDSYDPDNPLNGKIYFEWPVEIVAIDSYP